VAHRKARLNVFGRELLVTRVTVLGWPVTTAVDAQGVSRATGYKWVRRFRAEGTAGLVDRSSRPPRSPRATPAAEVERILAARASWRWGPDRLGPLLALPRRRSVQGPRAAAGKVRSAGPATRRHRIRTPASHIRLSAALTVVRRGCSNHDAL
jgi:hypothetical protein